MTSKNPTSLRDRLAYLAPEDARDRARKAGLKVRLESSFQGTDGYLLFGTKDLAQASLARIAEHVYALDVADRLWIPVKRSWRLNERHYGALQGKDKKQIRDEYGDEQFMLWRRSYDVPPPLVDLGSEFSQDADPRYADAPVVRAECLKDVLERALPYWHSDIVPDLQAGKTVLVAAHGNSIRAIVKYLDDVDDATIAGINIPTGIPLRYELDETTLKPIVKGGEYLDPEAAAESIKAVANQGK